MDYTGSFQLLIVVIIGWFFFVFFHFLPLKALKRTVSIVDLCPITGSGKTNTQLCRGLVLTFVKLQPTTFTLDCTCSCWRLASGVILTCLRPFTCVFMSVKLWWTLSLQQDTIHAQSPINWDKPIRTNAHYQIVNNRGSGPESSQNKETLIWGR